LAALQSLGTSRPYMFRGGVKVIRFSYSNKDTKDEEGRESWSARDDPYTRCHAPLSYMACTSYGRASHIWACIYASRIWLCISHVVVHLTCGCVSHTWLCISCGCASHISLYISHVVMHLTYRCVSQYVVMHYIQAYNSHPCVTPYIWARTS
jgi:hypothetical protein